MWGNSYGRTSSPSGLNPEYGDQAQSIQMPMPAVQPAPHEQPLIPPSPQAYAHDNNSERSHGNRETQQSPETGERVSLSLEIEFSE